MLRVFRGAFADKDEDADARARVMLNLCVGGMVLARTTDNPELRRSLRAAARAEALALLDCATWRPRRADGAVTSRGNFAR